MSTEDTRKVGKTTWFLRPYANFEKMDQCTYKDKIIIWIKEEVPLGLASSSLDRVGTTDDGGIEDHFLEELRQIISSRGYQEDLRWVALEETAFRQMEQILRLKSSDLSSPLSPAHGNMYEQGRTIDKDRTGFLVPLYKVIF